MKRVCGIVAATAVAVAVTAFNATDPVSAQAKAGFAERLYILDGGIGHSGNQNSWDNMMVPPGQPIQIAANAHLIKHPNGWMMFDTSSNDIIATMPNGYGTAAGAIRWTKTQAQTLEPQFKAIGIGFTDVKFIGISHAHADHAGNVHKFPQATVLIQRREYDQATANGGTVAGPPTFAGQIFPRNHPVSLLDGDYDVFGDGSVVLYYVGGHTQGSQIAMVRLPNTGYVVLSGDAVHLQSTWKHRRIPRIQAANDQNMWAERVFLAYSRIQDLMDLYKAQLWIHHDMEDYKGRKFAPQFYD